MKTERGTVYENTSTGPPNESFNKLKTDAETVYLITHTNTCAYIYNLRSLKFTLKHLKRSYMFRSHDNPQGAYIVPC